MNFIKRWFVKRAIKKFKQKSEAETILDDELLDTAKEHARLFREMEKRSRLIEAQRRNKQLIEAQERTERQLEDDEDEEEEDDEDSDDLGLSDILSPYLKQFAQQAILRSLPAGTKEVAVATDKLAAETSPIKKIAIDKINELSDDELLELYGKYAKK